ncbi:MAG: hypothetical protein KGJ84_06975, partial [Elusimicrobia bacterium]|nr:hypothetical protein [Elusimicrobiota bacterium]
DGWLASFDHSTSYKKNARRNFPRWVEFYAGVKKGWPAHRVEGYLLLARREAASAPKTARMDLEKARRAAAEAGLPAPTFQLPQGR